MTASFAQTPGVRRRLANLLFLTVVCAGSLTSCAWQEHMCSAGEYPAWRPDGPGKTCFANGTDPTPGYVRYPEGDVPDLLTDDYDPVDRYPALTPWVKDYVKWEKAGAQGEPPAMPSVG